MYTHVNIMSKCQKFWQSFRLYYGYTIHHNRTQSYDNIIAIWNTYHIMEVGENQLDKKKEDTYIEVSESRRHNSRKTDKWRASRPDVNRGQQ